MEIVPVAHLPKIIEPSHHENRREKQHQRQRKRERLAPVPVYKPDGGIEEEQTPNIDVLV